MRQELTLKTIISFLNGKGNPNKLGNQKFSGFQTSQLGTVQQQLMEQWKITQQNLWCMANHNIGSQSSSRKASHEWPDILSEKREYKQWKQLQRLHVGAATVTWTDDRTNKAKNSFVNGYPTWRWNDLFVLIYFGFVFHNCIFFCSRYMVPWGPMGHCHFVRLVTRPALNRCVTFMNHENTNTTETIVLWKMHK